MRQIGIISDVHADAESLGRILEIAEEENWEDIWHLGDAVGRGPRPDDCVSLIEDNCTIRLLGNHDAVASQLASAAPFRHLPSLISSLHTEMDTQAIMRKWPKHFQLKMGNRKALLVHASPRDPLWEWISTPQDCQVALFGIGAHFLIVGHTHEAICYFEKDQRYLNTWKEIKDGIDLGTGSRMVLNPGSVGTGKYAEWAVLEVSQDGTPLRWQPRRFARR